MRLGPSQQNSKPLQRALHSAHGSSNDPRFSVKIAPVRKITRAGFKPGPPAWTVTHGMLADTRLATMLDGIMLTTKFADIMLAS